MTSYREFKGRYIVRERDQIRSMNIGENIPTRGVTLLLMMSKGEKEKYKKNEDMGSSPKGRYHFPLMSKGERKIRRETSEDIDEEKWSQGEYECWNMSVSINAKGGYCWIVGCH
jgi:hypothetical protein